MPLSPTSSHGIPDPITTPVLIESTDTTRELVSGFTPAAFAGASLLNLSDWNGFAAIVFNTNGTFALSSVDGSTSFKVFPLSNSIILQVFDNVGNAIFQVDRNGGLHGKTGKALTFDL